MTSNYNESIWAAINGHERGDGIDGNVYQVRSHYEVEFTDAGTGELLASWEGDAGTDEEQLKAARYQARYGRP